MKIVAILFVLCAVAVSNVSGKKGDCFDKRKLIEAIMGMKGKGNPTPDDVKTCIKGQLLIKEKEKPVCDCMDECAASNTDPMELAKCAFTKIKVHCPDIAFLEKIMKKGGK